MANELTKRVMARIVDRLGPSAHYKPLPEWAKEEGKSENHTSVSQSQEITLKKLIHREMSIGSFDEGLEQRLSQEPLESAGNGLKIMKGLSHSGVVKLDDLVNALKK